MTEQWLSLPLSLARDIGVEAALLLHQLRQWHAQAPQESQLRLSEAELLHRLPFDRETLDDLFEALEEACLLQVSQHQQYFYFSFEPVQAKVKPVTSAAQRLQQAVAKSAAEIRNSARTRNRQDWATWEQNDNDETAANDDQPAARSATNDCIKEDWQPSATTLTMLAHQQVPQPFALAQRDAFVMWHIEKGTRGGFESRFISWVKRGWVDEQQQQNRNTTATESDRRSERERVRARLDDIFDTDW